ncbi:MAG: N-acetylmuramoyl-L-alanine amidase family protein [Bariatricus sp.]
MFSRRRKRRRNKSIDGNRRRGYTRKQQLRLRNYLKVGVIILVLLILILSVIRIAGCIRSGKYWEKEDAKIDATKPDIDVELLTVNEYSRPGTNTSEIQGIVIHYTANPGATAMQNRDYFEGLKDTHITKASSHFIVGLEGEIVQCVPTWEVAYASNSRNIDTVSIECCHPDESGEFNEKTYRSMVQLTAWLCEKFGLDENDVIRHYDVTGKICPKYFVENEAAWEQFKDDVKTALETPVEEN